VRLMRLRTGTGCFHVTNLGEKEKRKAVTKKKKGKRRTLGKPIVKKKGRGGSQALLYQVFVGGKKEVRGVEREQEGADCCSRFGELIERTADRNSLHQSTRGQKGSGNGQ